MKTLWIALAVMFIIATLGIIDVEIGFNDGTRFAYHSWIHLFA